MTADTVLLVTTSYDSGTGVRGGRLWSVVAFLSSGSTPIGSRQRFGQSLTRSVALQSMTGEKSITGAEVKSVWYRRNVVPNLPEELDPGTREFCEREARSFLEGTLSALPTQRWLSSPQAIRHAERKPYQLAEAARLGFTLPRTIVTNDQAAARRFARDSKLVAKAVSSGYLAGPGGNRAVFTSALAPSDLEDLDGLVLAPVTFQENVHKSSDIRATVVGDEVFAAEILSQSRESSREWIGGPPTTPTWSIGCMSCPHHSLIAACVSYLS